ncbi:hypothetical protein [Streptomyces sp. enrichment culture]|uniref:hypothetical protein n=1 Tax=Streptomyces sp. enrichment culture TaxID=1795815 RepID=UPI003F5462A5
MAVLAGGCAEQEETQEARLLVPPPTDEVYEIILPFDAYELSLEETYQDSAARDELIRRCLEKEGYDWPAIEYPKGVQDPKNRRRYGVIEMPVARKFGYHPAPGMLGSRDVVEQRERRDKSLSAEALKTVYNEKDGCGKKASGYLLRNGGKADYDLLRQLSAEIFKEARSKPEVKKASRAWTSCMAEKDFNYKAPADAIADERWWSEESDRASSAEIATAVADVECQDRSGLINALYRTEKQLQQQAVIEHQRYFDSLMRAKGINVANAREVLSGVG